ncbi:transglutaminase [Sporosarcina sp. BI001-red]|uniref:transglutaminase TgpA family protein n=1 Tax=Sporosarcina sp. BI001-red TaxID=2282866 RepID=UPI000E220751|nr:transglutaminaseTgpA domain-containing protein [Sporosarcina sp. BI001-red]REB05643.1 transglutaminase [Sporosarcina sp. BI001-red]
MKDVRIDKWLVILLYILAYFMTIEWLKPVAELTDTGHISHFYGFIGMSLLFGLLRIPGWIVVPIKVIYITLSLQFVFRGNEWLTSEALKMTVSDIAQSLTFIWSGQWMEISYLFRTGLFFILLWMLAYLIRFWIEYRKSIMLFFGMTVVFLSVVDTFTTFDASFAILRVMVIGLLLLGLLFPLRLSAKTKTKLPIRSYFNVIAPLGGLLLFVAIVAVLVPVKEPAWPDPVPFIRSAAGLGDSGNGQGISKVGYDPDDTQLGGPFQPDDSIVFEAYVDSRQYWRMETKNTYTSKGWIQFSSEEYPESQGSFSGVIGGQVLIPPRQRAEVEMYEPLPILPYPYGLQDLQTIEGLLYKQEIDSGKLTLNSDEPIDMTYQTEFVPPEYSLKELRETDMASLDSLRFEMDEFLDLPDELPARVNDLAQEVTKSSPSVYQKAQAIERYFGRSGFVYSRDEVAVPKENEDYVDQFLFETKRGYCDNFSSSMVVMLRSVGIPARWVKGFAPGQLNRDDNRDKYYTVTNNQAHSWVEAYMPGIGWMPFEPTIGFNGISNVNFDIEVAKDDEQEQDPIKRPEKKKKEQDQQAAKRKNNQESWLLQIIPEWLRSWVTVSIIAGGAVVVLAVGLYTTRKKWLPRVAVRQSRSKSEGWETFAIQYEQLLKQLNRIGIRKPAGMTLSNYAKEVDRMRGDDIMSTLTVAYEKGLYGQRETQQDWTELRKIWEDLIIETTG